MRLILVGHSCLFYVLGRFNHTSEAKVLGFILCKETVLSDIKQIYWVRAKANSSYHFRSNIEDLV